MVRRAFDIQPNTQNEGWGKKGVKEHESKKESTQCRLSNLLKEAKKKKQRKESSIAFVLFSPFRFFFCFSVCSLFALAPFIHNVHVCVHCAVCWHSQCVLNFFPRFIESYFVPLEHTITMRLFL